MEQERRFTACCGLLSVKTASAVVGALCLAFSMWSIGRGKRETVATSTGFSAEFSYSTGGVLLIISILLLIGVCLESRCLLWIFIIVFAINNLVDVGFAIAVICFVIAAGQGDIPFAVVLLVISVIFFLVGIWFILIVYSFNVLISLKGTVVAHPA